MIRQRRARQAIALGSMTASLLSGLVGKKNQRAIYVDDVQPLEERKHMYEQRGHHA